MREPQVHVSAGSLQVRRHSPPPARRHVDAISFVAEAGRTTAPAARRWQIDGDGTSSGASTKLVAASCDGVDTATVGPHVVRAADRRTPSRDRTISFKGSVRHNIAMARRTRASDQIPSPPAQGLHRLHHLHLTTSFEKLPRRPPASTGAPALPAASAQCIAIARAFLKDVPIILLDEADLVPPEFEHVHPEGAHADGQPRSSSTAIGSVQRRCPTKSASSIAAGSSRRGRHVQLLAQGRTYSDIAPDQVLRCDVEDDA